VEYRLQMWLQETTGDFLGDAIRYRRDTQRARAAVRFRNFHSPPAAPWLAFTCLKASHTSRLGMSNGFALFMGSSRCRLAHELG
jgi:hypothetical protein